ncbi:MAG: hypothetical protein SAK29_07730 [Scytonema sp. PMC 1069.18]|nr:hypothetical protein [Scytonema sp. PMC 1069.18]MEC4884444.1 hypothetical protein [Scytonema sp. PMC 1070.18]
MNPVKVMDWQTKQLSELPPLGDDNWESWLLQQGYELIDKKPLGYTELALYQQKYVGVYAMYHPVYMGLETESLYVNIPTEEQVQQLVDIAQRLISGMEVMFDFGGEEDDEDDV